MRGLTGRKVAPKQNRTKNLGHGNQWNTSKHDIKGSENNGLSSNEEERATANVIVSIGSKISQLKTLSFDVPHKKKWSTPIETWRKRTENGKEYSKA